MTSSAGETFRFRDFELDVAAYELRLDGRPVRLERQPMDLLILLVERRRQLVSRREIIERLWSRDVFVDVERGVNTAVRKVRQALRDSLDAPAYIETVPGKGYRFIAAVEVLPARRARIRLAVLPFENLSGDPEREYLADGLTEETIVSLGQIDPERLNVIGRTSSVAYKGTRKSVAVIGAELNVDYVVESSIQAERGRLRVVSKLIQVRDEVQVWSASYDREPASMLGVQQELSTAIANHIKLRLSPDRLDAVARRHTQNADAYDLYLRGRTLWNQLTPATTRRAVDYYARATQVDSHYALAWSGLADAYASSPINGDAPPVKMWSLARDAASHAVRVEPALAEAQASLGAVEFMLGWDWPASEAALRRAIELDPSYAWAHLLLGHLLSQTGRQSEAWRMMRRCCDLEPLSAMNHAISSQVAFQGRDYSAAAEHARQALVIDPEFWIGYMQRGQVSEQLGAFDVAFDALTNAARLSGSNSKPISLRGYMLAKLGRTHEAREALNMLKAVSRERYVPPYAMALVHAGLDEREAVFEWLDEAYAARDVHLIFVPVDPKWDPYREDPRFKALLIRCGFTRAGQTNP